MEALGDWQIGTGFGLHAARSLEEVLLGILFSLPIFGTIIVLSIRTAIRSLRAGLEEGAAIWQPVCDELNQRLAASKGIAEP